MTLLPRLSSRMLWLALTLAGACAQAATINGLVQLGNSTSPTPIEGAAVTLWEATPGASVHRGDATTDASGAFSIDSATGMTGGTFYVTARIGVANEFLALLGQDLPANIVVNEQTTVAGAYASAQMTEDGKISGTALELSIAAGMSANLVDITTGGDTSVMLEGPNSDQTNSLRTLHSLANVLNACVNSEAITADFLQKATPPGYSTPSTTAEAMSFLAQRPATNASDIYQISRLVAEYDRTLTAEVESWVIAVKVNQSGSDDPENWFGGPANVGFDSKGYAWVANNVVQGGTESAKIVMVLKPNGQPSDGSDNRPQSPISGGGILGVGWGVSVDSQDRVWFGNFGWGTETSSYPTQAREGNGSVAQFAVEGEAISPDDGFFQGPLSVQGIEPDADDNIWIASLGNDSLFFFPDGDPYRSKAVYQYTNAGPFGIGVRPDGEVWMSNSGGIAGKYQSSIARFKLDENGNPEQVFLKEVGDTLKVVASDSYGNAWLASQGDSMVYVFAADATGDDDPIGAYTAIGGLDGPWGLCVDGDDNVWIGNFGSLTPGEFGDGRVTQLGGANAATRPPGVGMGDAMSPDGGFRVESAGEQVLLPDNQTPLYGDGEPPSYAPQMRSTSVQIDRAGNLWTFNNWKPPFLNDYINNPGGDGLLIFVGLAPAPKKYDAELTKDSDGDGLIDEFEYQVINFSDSDAYVDFSDVTPGGDFDNDGLIESAEQGAGSSPAAEDTDGDLFDDQQEVDFGSDPTDPDSLPIEEEILVAVEYRFSTMVGYLYQVQFSDDLELWTDIGDPVVGDGEEHSVMLSVEGEGKTSENYRLLITLAE
ncbi:hypothetical protein [Cerasicoccus maritimus]|uniref:hypothetical protein n=1 Tax=Cerasicoccus maritimus TaxID=490089 RepID=UPI0028528012|nr:hypothetical protein [Cerasicoccus maritimus]